MWHAARSLRALARQWVVANKKLRKPADRLGKVVFANEVSIGGVGGGA